MIKVIYAIFDGIYSLYLLSDLSCLSLISVISFISDQLYCVYL